MMKIAAVANDDKTHITFAPLNRGRLRTPPTNSIGSCAHVLSFLAPPSSALPKKSFNALRTSSLSNFQHFTLTKHARTPCGRSLAKANTLGALPGHTHIVGQESYAHSDDFPKINEPERGYSLYSRTLLDFLAPYFF